MKGTYEPAQIGWDNPLQTYFAQVTDPSMIEEEEMICSFGATEELTTVKSPIGAISPYSVIPAQLQLLMREKFTTNRNADVIAKFGTIVSDQQTVTPNSCMGE